jgi:hypothetical protein
MKTSTLRSKPLVVFVLLAVILAGGLLSPGAPGASASTPLNVKLTNVLDKQFTVTWTTAVGEVGSVRWGTSVGSQPNTASDGRGTSYSGRTHHVTITGLAASTAYYFVIVSGGNTYDNSGTPYTATTTATPASPPSPDSITALVNRQSGSGATDAVVYAVVRNTNGSGSDGAAGRLSGYIQSGVVFIDLKSARTTAGAPFDYSDGDTVDISAEGGADGTASQSVVLASPRPDPLVTLTLVTVVTPTPTATSVPSTPTSTPMPTLPGVRAQVVISPSLQTIPLGTGARVDLMIQNVGGLFGGEVHISFDPSKVQVVDPVTMQPTNTIQAGNIFQGKTFSTYKNTADNTVGRVSYAVALYGMNTEPFTGTATLASMTLKAIGVGSSTIAFTSVPSASSGVLLSDKQGAQIPADTQEGRINTHNLGHSQGKVSLQGRGNHSGPTVAAVGVSLVITDSNGVYALTDIVSGTYAITITMPGYLKAWRSDMPVMPGRRSVLPDVTLLGGDATGDGAINILDLSLIGGVFGLCSGNSGWDSKGDINGDICVNILDASLAGGNFGRVAPGPWPGQPTIP